MICHATKINTPVISKEAYKGQTSASRDTIHQVHWRWLRIDRVVRAVGGCSYRPGVDPERVV